jgi:hypothetical protein
MDSQSKEKESNSMVNIITTNIMMQSPCQLESQIPKELNGKKNFTNGKKPSAIIKKRILTISIEMNTSIRITKKIIDKDHNTNIKAVAIIIIHLQTHHINK